MRDARGPLKPWSSMWKYENQYNFIIPRDNHENNEHHIIPNENHENHLNLGSPLEN